jgi:two-component system chemotaxis response regulator CheY
MLTNLDNGVGGEFLAECSEELNALEAALLALENKGTEVNEDLANCALRLAHSIGGAAHFLEFAKIGDLANQTADVLALFCSHKMIPTRARIDVLLRATDRLRDLIQEPRISNQADIVELMSALAGLPKDYQASPVRKAASAAGNGHSVPRRLRVLLVEDDFTSRLVLQTFLSRYGDCHVAVNGREAVDACRLALDKGQNYDLICMDIMMPEMDGREAVRQIRTMEETYGIFSTRGAKITMTTTVGEIKKVFQCFKELCDGYLVKPIDLTRLMEYMESWDLIKGLGSTRPQVAK